MDFEKLLKRHKRVLFLFSGGKDSVAVYHLIKPYLDRIVVGFVDTGDSAPEILSYIEKIEAQTPNFVRYTSDVKSWIKENGHPSDVVPVEYTSEGHLYGSPKNLKITSYFSCCNANIWEPLAKLAHHVKADAIITGQRNDDEHKSPVQNGTFDGSFHHYYPIVDWNEDQVRAYIKEQGETDARFDLDHTSIDCLTCTAYCASQPERMEYVSKKYPDRYAEMVTNLTAIKDAVISEMVGMYALTKGYSNLDEEQDEV